MLRALDARTLLLPDRRGNRILDSDRNVIENPAVALLAFVPGESAVLLVRGTARTHTDPALLAPSAVEGRAPQLGLAIAVREVLLHRTPALHSAGTWRPEARLPRSALPSFGRMLVEQGGARGLRGALAARVVDAALSRDARKPPDAENPTAGPETPPVQQPTIEWTRPPPPLLPVLPAAPRWSLGALQLLVGYAVETAPAAVAALLHRVPDGRAAAPCHLLYDAIAFALASAPARQSLDGLLATLLAPEAARYRGLPLSELAMLLGAQPLPRRRALALLWILGRHPSWAARRLEERLNRVLHRPGGPS